VKQANLRHGGRTLGQKVGTLPDAPTVRANKPNVPSPHSDSYSADCPIPRSIATLIEILAREALKDVIAEHLKLQACDDERQETADSGRPNETAIALPDVIKTKSCPQQDPRQIYPNKIR
jgi:hypothetical protein